MKNIIKHGKNAFINQFSTKREDDKVTHIEGKYCYIERKWIGCDDSVFFSATTSHTRTEAWNGSDESHDYDD